MTLKEFQDHQEMIRAEVRKTETEYYETVSKLRKEREDVIKARRNDGFDDMCRDLGL